MMKNQLAGLMKQAQQMQDNMKKAQEELARIEVEGQSGAGLVKVVMTCRHDVKRVTIDPSLLREDKDMLEDLVAAAINDAVRRVETTTQEKMSRPHGGHAAAARLQAAVLSATADRRTMRSPRRARPPPRRSRCRASTRWRARCAACRASARRPRSGWRCTCCSTIATARVRLAHALQHAARHGPPLRALQHVHRGHALRAVPLGASATPSLLCVVETPADLLMVEQTQAYSGLYFVLMGRLSPLDGIGPKEIRLDRLLKRATDGVVREVDARDQLHQRRRGDGALHRRAADAPAGSTVSRLARGVPVGGELEYVDSGTLAQALRERRTLGGPDAAARCRQPPRRLSRRPAEGMDFPERAGIDFRQ